MKYSHNILHWRVKRMFIAYINKLQASLKDLHCNHQRDNQTNDL